MKYELYNLSLAHGLSQLITELTTEMNLLDLMFTNSKGSLSNVRVLDPIHDLDHFPIFATVEFKLRIKCRNKFSRRVWHYENGNYENLALEIKILHGTYCLKTVVATLMKWLKCSPR